MTIQMMRWALLVALAVLIGACGATPTSTDPSPGRSTEASFPDASIPPPGSVPPVADDAEAPDACGLLTDSDIAEITGWEVDTVEPGPAMGIYQNGCTWVLAGGSAAPAEIELGVLSPGGRSYFDTYFAPYAEDEGSEPLEGVGDVGLVGGISGSAMAVQGDLLADVYWLDFGDGGDDVAIALLERVLANVGR